MAEIDQKIRVLIVEDDFIQAETLSEKLKNLGYELFGIADSYDKAADLIENDRPDIALLDIHLKGEKTGFDLAQVLMFNHEIPIIFISAYSDKSTIEKIKTITPHAYLIKPFDQDELQVLIQSAYERYQMYRTFKKQTLWIHSVLDNVNEGVVVTDSEGVIKFLNPVAEKFLDSSAIFSLGRSFTDVYQLYNYKNENFDNFSELLKSYSRDNNYYRASQGMNSDTDWLEVDIKTINDEYIISFRELDQKHSSMLLHSEAIKKSGNPIFISDNDVDFGPHIVEANASFAKLTGIDHQEVKGKSLAILVDANTEEQFFDDLKKAFQKGKVFQTETSCYFNSSTPHRLKLKFSPIEDYTGSVSHWICNCEDITEERKLIQQVKQSEARLRSILDNSNEVLIFVDENFTVQDFNIRAQEIVKDISDKKIESGESILTYFDKLQIKDFQSEIEKALDGEQVKIESGKISENGASKAFSIDLTPVEPYELSGGGVWINIRRTDKKSGKTVTHENELITVIDPEYKITFHESSGTEGDQLNFPAGDNLLDYIHPDDHQSLKEAIQKATQQSDTYPPVDFRVKDRSDNWRNIQSVIENQSDNPFVQGIILNSRDNTDIYQTQKALEFSEDRYEKLIERIPVGYFRTSPEGKLVSVNSRFVELLGYDSSDELLNMDLSTKIYFSTEERDSALRKMQKLEGESHELRLKKKDGSTVWVEEHALPRHDIDGRLIYYEGIIQDITERKKTDEILQNLAEGLATSTGDLFFQSLSKNLAKFFEADYARIIRLNPENEKEAYTIAYHGTDKIELNKAFDISGTILEKVVEQDGILIEPQKVKDSFQEDYLNKLKVESFAGTKLLDDEGQPIGLLVIMNTGPINEKNFVMTTLQIMASRASAELQRFNYEQQLIDSKEEAEKLNRLKSNFLANMSDEVRKPLNNILGYVTEIEKSEDQKQLWQHLGKIKDSGNSLLFTLDSLIELARLEADRVIFDLSEINISEHIEPAIDHFKALAKEKNLELTTDIKTKDSVIKADKIIFSQILHNLLDNALKFTDEGSIHLEISEEEINDDNYARITVSDTGSGIDPDFLPHIFEEFKQDLEGLRSDVRGIGLGLTITQRYVEYLGGTIDAESQKNEGTSFILRFPLIGDSKVEKAPVDASDSADKKLAKDATLPDLLLLEDSPESRKICNLFLKNHLRVDTAENEDQALNKLQEYQYDIILIDIHLGHGGSGISALSKLRELESYKNTPVIAVSGYGTSGDRQKFIEAGFDDFISKPYTKNHLLSTIQSHLSDLQTG